MSISPSEARHDAVETLYDGSGRAVWGAIFAGLVFALAVFALLSLVGLGLGFTLVEATEDTPMNGALTTTAIWQFVSQLIALGAGGYVAGRLAGVQHTIGALIHGAIVWAGTTLAAFYLATVASMGLVNVTTSAITSLVSGATTATQAVLPDDFNLPDVTMPTVTMDDLPDEIARTLRQNGVTPANFQQETREAFRNVLSQNEQAQIREEAIDATQDVIRTPGDIARDGEQFVDAIYGRGGVLSEEDRQEAIAVMERRFGISPQDAEEFIDTVQARAEAYQQDAMQAIDEAQTAAVQAADTAADAIATAAWLAFLASLLGLAAAAGGAVAGRPARG